MITSCVQKGYSSAVNFGEKNKTTISVVSIALGILFLGIATYGHFQGMMPTTQLRLFSVGVVFIAQGVLFHVVSRILPSLNSKQIEPTSSAETKNLKPVDVKRLYISQLSKEEAPTLLEKAFINFYDTNEEDAVDCFIENIMRPLSEQVTQIEDKGKRGKVFELKYNYLKGLINVGDKKFEEALKQRVWEKIKENPGDVHSKYSLEYKYCKENALWDLDSDPANAFKHFEKTQPML